MDAKPFRKRKRVKKRDIEDNPIHDSFAQELGYKLDERTVSCLVIVGAIAFLVILVVAFLIYWSTH